MKIIDESPAELPSVLICDSNPFTTLESQLLIDQMMKQLTYNKRDFLGINTGLGLDQLGFYNFYILQSNPDINPCFDVFQYATAVSMDPTLFTDSQRKKLGWDLPQVVIKCKFNGIDCDISKDFQWYFSSQYGNCYEFNSASLNNQVI